MLKSYQTVCDGQYEDAIKGAKDLSAAAVLILSVMAAVIGVVIFPPKVATFSV